MHRDQRSLRCEHQLKTAKSAQSLTMHKSKGMIFQMGFAKATQNMVISIETKKPELKVVVHVVVM